AARVRLLELDEPDAGNRGEEAAYLGAHALPVGEVARVMDGDRRFEPRRRGRKTELGEERKGVAGARGERARVRVAGKEIGVLVEERAAACGVRDDPVGVRAREGGGRPTSERPGAVSRPD